MRAEFACAKLAKGAALFLAFYCDQIAGSGRAGVVKSALRARVSLLYRKSCAGGGRSLKGARSSNFEQLPTFLVPTNLSVFAPHSFNKQKQYLQPLYSINQIPHYIIIEKNYSRQCQNYSFGLRRVGHDELAAVNWLQRVGSFWRLTLLALSYLI